MDVLDHERLVGLGDQRMLKAGVDDHRAAAGEAATK